jgi:hypothetical protein
MRPRITKRRSALPVPLLSAIWTAGPPSSGTTFATLWPSALSSL